MTTTSSSSPTPPPDGGADARDQLAGAYVLGTLALQGRREVESRLPHDPLLREAVQRWEERLHPLALAVPPQEPSAALWPRIERSLGWTGAAAAATPPAAHAGRAAGGWAGWWNDLRLWRGLAGGGFAAAAILAAVLLTRLGAPAAPQYMVVLVAPGDTAPGWVVQSGASSRDLRLVPLRDTVVPPGKSLQFWTKADQWAGPQSLGLVPPGTPVTVPIDRLPPLQPNQLFELTLEPEAGSPIGRPTGPIVFIGRAVKML